MKTPIGAHDLHDLDSDEIDAFLNFLLKRLREASTWAGIAAAITGYQTGGFLGAVAAATGFVAIALRERGSPS